MCEKKINALWFGLGVALLFVSTSSFSYFKLIKKNMKKKFLFWVFCLANKLITEFWYYEIRTASWKKFFTPKVWIKFGVSIRDLLWFTIRIRPLRIGQKSNKGEHFHPQISTTKWIVKHQILKQTRPKEILNKLKMLIYSQCGWNRLAE